MTGHGELAEDEGKGREKRREGWAQLCCMERRRGAIGGAAQEGSTALCCLFLSRAPVSAPLLSS
jgi:hypothetical protein